MSKTHRRCVNVRKRVTKRCTKRAFSENIRECMCRTDKPRAQCIAIAYAVMRRACKKARKKVPR